MDFNSSGGSKMSPSDRSALMSNIKQQLDVAHATELLQQINEKCFKMCVQKPGSSLSNTDQVKITYFSFVWCILKQKA